MISRTCRTAQPLRSRLFAPCFETAVFGHHGLRSALRQRPTLAAAIGILTGIWANIEHELGLIMASILGTDAPLGIAIWLNLRSEGPQHQGAKDSR
jgi:hypothetical protein